MPYWTSAPLLPQNMSQSNTTMALEMKQGVEKGAAVPSSTALTKISATTLFCRAGGSTPGCQCGGGGRQGDVNGGQGLRRPGVFKRSPFLSWTFWVVPAGDLWFLSGL